MLSIECDAIWKTKRTRIFVLAREIGVVGYVRRPMLAEDGMAAYHAA